MTDAIDLAALERPTIVEVWAPRCVECRAMQPDLAETAAAFAGTVDLLRVNAAEEGELVRRLGVMGTPTLIGVYQQSEVFRFTGRRSAEELAEIFTTVSVGETASRIGRQDMTLRVGAGIVLGVLGLAAGPAWPLVAVGAGVIAIGLYPLTRFRR